MNPRVANVKPEQNYTLHLWFKNGEEGVLDMKPYLDKGIFRDLQDVAMFNTVRPFLGTIQWANEADLCPDTVYLDSVKI
jgi:metal-dependent amidase/aminoacylase/carboxypeptidase family protein